MIEGIAASNKADTETNEQDDQMETDGMFCEFCYKEGKKGQSADGFCVECVTYFCATCLKYHGKFHPNHTQQDKDNMPQYFYLQTCPQHSDELIKFYCLECDTAACSTCEVNYHDQCEEIHHLPKLVKDFDKIEEFVEIKDAIEKAEREVNDIELIIDKAMEKVKQYNENAECAMKKDRKEINEIFDTMENETNEVERMDRSKLETEKGKIRLIKSNIKTLKSELENNTTKAPKSEVFMSVKAAKVESQSTLKYLQKLRTQLEETEISKYEYVPVEQKPGQIRRRKLKDCKEKVKYGYILEWSVVVLILSLVMKSVLFETSIKLHEMKLSFDPLQLCHISKDKRLTIAFSLNTVHTVDLSKNMELRNGISSYVGSSITMVNDDKVAILNSNGYITVHVINDNMDHMHRIRVSKLGQHMVYSNDIFFILFGGKESHIESYNMNGKLLRNIPIGNRFQIISPWNMAVSPDNSFIYLTDSDLVIMSGIDGEVKRYFRHIDLVRPTGMTTDTAGNLYVCGYLSDNVSKISADLSHGFELLGKKHGLNRPFSISYNEKENELSVGSFGQKSIQVFKTRQSWYQHIRSLVKLS